MSDVFIHIPEDRFTHPSLGYWVINSSDRRPSRWHRFWASFLLGWRWVDRAS